jgi:two-component system, NarL family, nitrate/nitrite response regulator NarL
MRSLLASSTAIKVEVVVSPARTRPGTGARAMMRGGGKAVEANGTPNEGVLSRPDARRLRVAVVAAARFTREVLEENLGSDPLVSVVRLCADLSELVATSPALETDIVLFDTRVPEGISAVRRALDIAPGLRIVALALQETEEEIVGWAEAGIVGYIPNTAARADLVRLVLEIYSGEQVCSGRVAAGLLRRIALSAGPGSNAALPIAGLTKRERQVAELIRAGLSDKELARRLNISLATTKSHVHSLLGKLSVRRRNEVADRWREYGSRMPRAGRLPAHRFPERSADRAQPDTWTVTR